MSAVYIIHTIPPRQRCWETYHMKSASEETFTLLNGLRKEAFEITHYQGDPLNIYILLTDQTVFITVSVAS